MSDAWLLLLGTILANNFVVPRTLGFFPYLSNATPFDNPWKMGMITASVLIPASAAAYLIEHLLLTRYNIEYLWLVVTMVVIAAIVQSVGLVWRAHDPRVQSTLRLYLPLIATNCTILAVGVATIVPRLGPLETLIYTLAASVGFTIAIATFGALQARLNAVAAPRWFRGPPLTLITIGLTLLAFMGLTEAP